MKHDFKDAITLLRDEAQRLAKLAEKHTHDKGVKERYWPRADALYSAANHLVDVGRVAAELRSLADRIAPPDARQEETSHE